MLVVLMKVNKKSAISCYKLKFRFSIQLGIFCYVVSVFSAESPLDQKFHNLIWNN
jgi:hypothetical protein